MEADRHRYACLVQAKAIKLVIGIGRPNFNKWKSTGLAKSSEAQNYRFHVDSNCLFFVIKLTFLKIYIYFEREHANGGETQREGDRGS